ncbi:MAG: glycoside hydrolase family 30 protein [Candidatus Izimaplasma sp.]|nr:glycoside hydrolase family 30 protein [Candidatus Izimaplasma bacterium]
MAKIFITEKDSNKRFEESVLIENNNLDSVDVVIDEQITYQTIIGFGGAFTESAAYNLSRVNKKVREKAIKAYFDKEDGLGYTIGRVSIHSCDFSLNSFTYIEEGDIELKTFDISRDLTYVIPLIKDASLIAGKNISLLASPWSPPAFMKDNNSMIFGGKLLPKYYNSWARYYVRFIEEYRKQGLDVWGITIQNEPAAVQRWDSCIYSAEEERDFIKNHLGPIMEKSNVSNVRVLIWDHNRDIMIQRASTVLNDYEAAKYVWGTAFHWYGEEKFENVGKVHNLFPNKGLLFTEGCQEGGVHFNSWNTGERYARNMIGDLNNWCEGYIDWNLFLDNTGGPNHVNNLCDSPIIVDIFPEKLIQQSSYYYIGHFSKYIRPGAKRVKLNNNHENLKMTAFLNKDSSLAFVVLNEENSKQNFKFKYKNKKYGVTINKNSIMTIIV